MTDSKTTASVAESAPTSAGWRWFPGRVGSGEQWRRRGGRVGRRESGRCCPTSSTPAPARPSVTPGRPTWWSRSPRRRLSEVARLRSGQTLISFLAPRNADNQIGALRAPACRPSPSRRSRASRGRRPWMRAVLAGQRRRVQGRAARGQRVHPLLPDADHRCGHCEAGPACWCSASVWLVCRRWRLPSGSVRRPPDTTSDPRSPTRCARSVRNG